MANEWKVLIDVETDNTKRFIEIDDTVNDRRYNNYFPLNTSDTAILQRFKEHVKEHRATVTARNTPKLNLSNFEASL